MCSTSGSAVSVLLGNTELLFPVFLVKPFCVSQLFLLMGKIREVWNKPIHYTNIQAQLCCTSMAGHKRWQNSFSFFISSLRYSVFKTSSSPTVLIALGNTKQACQSFY